MCETPDNELYYYLCCVAGYGFVDFESNMCAENAVKGLQAKGIQAQMAKVGITQPRAPASVRVCMQVFSNTLKAQVCQHFILSALENNAGMYTPQLS